MACGVLGAIRAVCAEVRDSDPERRQWIDLEEKEVWRELVAGILGSRVRYETAVCALESLANADLLEPDGHRCRRSDFQNVVSKSLKPVMNFLRKLSVQCKYIPAVRWGWRSSVPVIQVMSAMRSGRFALLT
jgi:hypothetical protein